MIQIVLLLCMQILLMILIYGTSYAGYSWHKQSWWLKGQDCCIDECTKSAEMLNHGLWSFTPFHKGEFQNIGTKQEIKLCVILLFY
jgi:hypothetical protein